MLAACSALSPLPELSRQTSPQLTQHCLMATPSKAERKAHRGRRSLFWGARPPCGNTDQGPAGRGISTQRDAAPAARVLPGWSCPATRSEVSALCRNALNPSGRPAGTEPGPRGSSRGRGAAPSRCRRSRAAPAGGPRYCSAGPGGWEPAGAREGFGWGSPELRSQPRGQAERGLRGRMRRAGCPQAAALPRAVPVQPRNGSGEAVTSFLGAAERPQDAACPPQEQHAAGGRQLSTLEGHCSWLVIRALAVAQKMRLPPHRTTLTKRCPG